MTLLLTFLDIIKDYKTPPNKNLSWDLDKHIRTQVINILANAYETNFFNLITVLLTFTIVAFFLFSHFFSDASNSSIHDI